MRGAPSPRCAQLGGAHAVTCLDPAAPQLPDRVVGEARAQPGPEHAHVPREPRGRRPPDCSSRGHPPGSPLTPGGTPFRKGRRRRRGGRGPRRVPAPRPSHSRLAALPPSRRQGRACSAICWPRGDREVGAEPRARGPEPRHAPAPFRAGAPSARLPAQHGRHAAPAPASTRLPGRARRPCCARFCSRRWAAEFDQTERP